MSTACPRRVHSCLWTRKSLIIRGLAAFLRHFCGFSKKFVPQCATARHFTPLTDSSFHGTQNARQKAISIIFNSYSKISKIAFQLRSNTSWNGQTIENKPLRASGLRKSARNKKICFTRSGLRLRHSKARIRRPKSNGQFCQIIKYPAQRKIAPTKEYIIDATNLRLYFSAGRLSVFLCLLVISNFTSQNLVRATKRLRKSNLRRGLSSLLMAINSLDTAAQLTNVSTIMPRLRGSY